MERFGGVFSLGGVDGLKLLLGTPSLVILFLWISNFFFSSLFCEWNVVSFKFDALVVIQVIREVLRL